MKEGLPSLICTTCIDRLRVAYDFRSVCLQSDTTLQRYVAHLQNEAKQALSSTSKFDFTIPTTQESLPNIIEEPQNAFELKHFLDNDEELNKTDHLVDATTSPSSSPDPTTTFLNVSVQHEQQATQQQQHVRSHLTI